MANLKGRGFDARVSHIESLVNDLVSNVDTIQQGRRELTIELLAGVTSGQQLTTRNASQLFPLVNTSVDSQFYNVMTSFPEVGEVGIDNLSEDILDYVHLYGVSASAALGHTLLLIASLMQDPTYVARIQESYDSVAGRLDRDIEYLESSQVAHLEMGVVRLAKQMLEESRGDDGYFARLEHRLELIRAENILIEENVDILDQLLVQVAALDLELRRLPTPIIPTIPEDAMIYPGITATEVHFGQSAALMGGNATLGMGMQAGITAAFEEANRNGGVNGRTLKLTTMDDRYEPDLAFERTLRLIDNEQVFALIGSVGTPTSRAALPLASSRGVPFVGPFTGAQFLRDDDLTNVLNVRASYHQETGAMVNRLVDAGYSRVAVLYQNDSFGIDGLRGVEQALTAHDMEPVASWYYTRNSSAVLSAAFRIGEAEPEAVIIIGAHAPATAIIEKLRENLGSETIFMNVSFVGSDQLADALGDDTANVYVTQVVPLPDGDSVPVLAKYRAALAALPDAPEPGFISLEGYLAGRLAIARLESCESNLNRECFLNVLSSSSSVSIDGVALQFGPDDNQGSDMVILTEIGTDGTFVEVDSLPNAP